MSLIAPGTPACMSNICGGGRVNCPTPDLCRLSASPAHAASEFTDDDDRGHDATGIVYFATPGLVMLVLWVLTIIFIT